MNSQESPQAEKRPTMTKNAWNTFVQARYAGLVKAASTVVGQANAADAVQGALLRAATTKTYLDCRIDPFTWVLATVTSVAANSPRGVKTHRAVDALFEQRTAKPEHGVGGVPKPHELGAVGALVNLKRLDRQVEIQLALDSSNQKEIEAERIYDAETAAMLARIRANRKPKQGHASQP
jgi:DNA-directed RNA polymerase specialized sigma24 family protein